MAYVTTGSSGRGKGSPQSQNWQQDVSYTMKMWNILSEQNGNAARVPKGKKIEALVLSHDSHKQCNTIIVIVLITALNLI